MFYKKRSNASLFPDNFDLYHKDIRERQLLQIKKYETRAFAVKLGGGQWVENVFRLVVQCLVCEKYFHLLKCQEEEQSALQIRVEYQYPRLQVQLLGEPGLPMVYAVQFRLEDGYWPAIRHQLLSNG